MKYSEIREDALVLIEEERAEKDKAKREAAAREIKTLMLEIERTEEILTTMRDQLEAKMDEEVKDKVFVPDGYPLGGYVISESDLARVANFNNHCNRLPK